ncbi:MAG: hypothetical protein ACOC5R_00330 [Elusimicrobiota bacterium]
MKIANAILILLQNILGFFCLISAVEKSYLLSSYLILGLVIVEIIKKIWFKKSYISVKKINFTGNLIWIGSATSIVLWRMFFNKFGMLGTGISLIFIISAIVWHTKNCEREYKDINYTGLYLPAAGGLIVSGLITIINTGIELINFLKVISVLVLFISYLMVSDIEYYNFVKFQTKNVKNILYFCSIFTLIIIIGFYSKWWGMLVIFSIYLFYGIVKEVKKRWIR